MTTLTTVWLNNAAAPTSYIYFSQMAALSYDESLPGEVRRYAGGRRRVVRRSGVDKVAVLTLPYCDSTQRGWLRENLGKTICLRDDRGVKMFGVYLGIPGDEARTEKTVSITLTVTQITHVEAAP